MSIIKRKGSPNYYVRFTAPDGTRVFESARTTSRRAAEEFEAQLKARLWREHQLGESQATWPEAVISWLSSTKHKDRSTVEQRLKWLHPHMGHLAVRSVTGATLHEIRAAKLAEGAAAGTVNRYLAVVSAVLHHAKSREWLASVPPIPRMDEPKGKLRFLSEAEASELIAYLDEQPRSEHLIDMIEFTLATGLREANVTGLRWDWLDLERRLAFVPSEKSKSGRLIRIPLNSLALEVLERRRGLHDEWVFTYRGRRIMKANRDGFRAAVEAMGWGDVSWHTLRHTWASWHVMAGTPLQVVMELGGWTSYQMVLRYAHLSPDHLSEFAGAVVQNLSQSGSGGATQKARKA
jgi:integrase